MSTVLDSLIDELNVNYTNNPDIKNQFLKKLFDIKLPYTTNIDGDLSFLLDHHDLLLHDDVPLDDHEWNKVKNEIHDKYIKLFNQKKNQLIAIINDICNNTRSINHSRSVDVVTSSNYLHVNGTGASGECDILQGGNLVEEEGVVGKLTSYGTITGKESTSETNDTSSIDTVALPSDQKKYKGKRKRTPMDDSIAEDVLNENSTDIGNDSSIISVYRLNYMNSTSLISLIHEKYKSLKVIANNYKIESSRLSKQNAFLKFELKNYANQQQIEIDKPKDETSDGSGSVESKVVKFEDITEDMIIGSSLYSKLFDYSKHLEAKITLLEQENIELKTKLVNTTSGLDVKYYEFVEGSNKITDELINRVDGIQKKFIDSQEQLIALKEKNEYLTSEYDKLKLEHEDLLVKLQDRDERLIKLTSQNSAIRREFIESNDNNEQIKAYKDQILNISEELEDISRAFEEKQILCDSLMRKLNESSVNKDKLNTIQHAYTNLQEKVNKISSLCENKIASYQAKNEALIKHLDSYKDGWLYSYKRSCQLEQQRDIAYSALCELQSQYRRSCKSQKALQHQVSILKTNSIESSLSLDNANGQVSVLKENDILRRKLTCNVCSEEFVSHCITKCGHLYCNKCIDSNIKSRNRKCPQCKITFDKVDVKRIFLD